jgi:hypothetical protein
MRRQARFVAAVLVAVGFLAHLPTPIYAEQSLQSFKEDCTRAGGFIVVPARSGANQAFRVTCHYPDGGRSNCSTLDISDEGVIIASDSTCVTVWNEQTTAAGSAPSMGSRQPAAGTLPLKAKTVTPGSGQR